MGASASGACGTPSAAAAGRPRFESEGSYYASEGGRGCEAAGSCPSHCSNPCSRSELAKRQLQTELRRQRLATEYFAKRSRSHEPSGASRQQLSPWTKATFQGQQEGRSVQGLLVKASTSESAEEPSSPTIMFKNAMAMTMAERALSKDSAQVLANPRGTTPLMHVCAAAGTDSAEAVRQLLVKRADINAKDYRGWGCLHHACRSGCDDVVRQLLEANACMKERTADGKTSLILAAEGGHCSTMKVLAKGGDDFTTIVNCHDHNGSTALHGASRCGDLAGVKLLVVCKAKVISRDRHGMQPITLLCASGSVSGVKFMLERKARLDVLDESMCTPLHYAVSNNHDRLALHLVKQKADPDAANDKGETPEAIARARHLVKFMREIDHRLGIAALAD